MTFRVQRGYEKTLKVWKARIAQEVIDAFDQVVNHARLAIVGQRDGDPCAALAGSTGAAETDNWELVMLP